MKKTLHSLALLCLILLGYNSYAQNPMKEYNFKNTSNGLDLATGLPAGSGYFISGNISPTTVGPYNNMGPLGPLDRIKLQLVDQNLNPQLLRTYVDPAELSVGCNFLNMAYYVSDGKQMQNRDLVMCGNVKRNVDITYCPTLPQFSEAFILRTSVNGSVVFYKRYKGNVGFSSIVEDPTTGNLLVCGSTTVNSSMYAFVAGFNSTGVPLWSYRVYDTFSQNNEIAPCDLGGRRYYAVTGLTFEKSGSNYAANNMVLMLVDANGTLYQSAMLSTGGTFANLFTGWGVNSAYDNTNVIITGQLGNPNIQGDSAHLHIMKINPLSLSINFLRYYNNNRYSWGNSITTDPTNSRICVTGTNLASGQGVYLETNGSGSLTRLTHYISAMAIEGKSIVYNTSLNYPAFDGNSTPGSFMCLNSFGHDCIDNFTPAVIPYTPIIYSLRTRPIQITPVNATLQPYNVGMPEYWSCQPPALMQSSNEMGNNNQPQNLMYTIGDSKVYPVAFPGAYEVNNAPAMPTDVGTIQQHNELSLSVYPNPSSGIINATYTIDRPYQLCYIEVTDMYGRSIMKKQVEGNKGQLNISLPDNIASQNLILSLWCDGQILDKRTVTLVR